MDTQYNVTKNIILYNFCNYYPTFC